MSKDKETEVAEATPEERVDKATDVPTGADASAAASADVGEQDEEILDGSPDKKAKKSKRKSGAEEKLRSEIADLVEENEQLKNDYLRKTADFENFRKRMFREREEAIKYGNSNLLEDLVDIIDNFERAIKSSEDSEDFAAFRSGIVMIEQQFTGMLERKYGMKRFESLGAPFDPERHAAIATDDEGDGAQVVSEDYQKGYMLHDRVLRHAKVKVSRVSEGELSDSDDKREDIENIDKKE